jgi:hypothetical protein
MPAEEAEKMAGLFPGSFDRFWNGKGALSAGRRYGRILFHHSFISPRR